MVKESPKSEESNLDDMLFTECSSSYKDIHNDISAAAGNISRHNFMFNRSNTD